MPEPEKNHTMFREVGTSVTNLDILATRNQREYRSKRDLYIPLYRYPQLMADLHPFSCAGVFTSLNKITSR